MNSLSDEKAEAALEYLVSTDETAAEAKAAVARAEYKLKRMEATVYAITTGTVGERKAAIDTNEWVLAAQDEHIEAITAFNTIANKRTTQALVIEVWRSVQANRRKG